MLNNDFGEEVEICSSMRLGRIEITMIINYGAWMTTFSTNPYFIFSNVSSVILHSLSRNCFTIKNQILLLFQKVP